MQREFLSVSSGRAQGALLWRRGGHRLRKESEAAAVDWMRRIWLSYKNSAVLEKKSNQSIVSLLRKM